MRRGRRNDIFDQPWVPIAAVIGVVAVIAIAAFFFMGGFGSGGESQAPAATTTSSGSTGSSSSSPVASGTVNPAVIKTQAPVSVPSEGVFVRVDYIGSFSGTYGMDRSMETAKDSGTRLYEIPGATGTVSASFKKTDTSTKPHELTVEIYKNGKVLKFDKTTEPKGEVTVSYTL
ncbi:MAG: hypothetical protein GYA23_08430 [Methanomicrobiales archaeon]|nr:hypothetical protein [Methanomicrobiales archaeon]